MFALCRPKIVCGSSYIIRSHILSPFPVNENALTEECKIIDNLFTINIRSALDLKRRRCSAKFEVVREFRSLALNVTIILN